MSKKVTPAQLARQEKRSSHTGRYKQNNPCDACGRSTGLDYFTEGLAAHHGHDGPGFMLCGKPACNAKLPTTDDPAALTYAVAKLMATRIGNRLGITPDTVEGYRPAAKAQLETP